MLALTLGVAVTQFLAAGCWWRRNWLAAVPLNLAGFTLWWVIEALLVR
ncbi:hypothetical protein [Lignipirellula cremea]|uniref:Uncharacterized protein n=1 Tax=Lignipirellula cremea TaxID=2528010 RepID=A0A518DV74_9BACT|nr:hypothetical protein [Lignipirellula cremea]QDU95733.1 hypothetical protein Pla8534_35500 [Lignipirellula cremea]